MVVCDPEEAVAVGTVVERVVGRGSMEAELVVTADGPDNTLVGKVWETKRN